MFPRRYFAGRYFAPRYWPQGDSSGPPYVGVADYYVELVGNNSDGFGLIDLVGNSGYRPELVGNAGTIVTLTGE